MRPVVIAYPRICGAILILIGLALGWWRLWEPIREAQSGATAVSSDLRGVIGVTFLLPVGLAYIFFGRRGVEFVWPEEGESKVKLYIVVTVLALVAIGIQILSDRYLASLGYGH
jgi:hypothetical protein